jgi:hypothetical protein
LLKNNALPGQSESYFCNSILTEYQTFTGKFRYNNQLLSKMKKFLQATLILAAAAVLFSSCRAHEKCPAYGQHSKPATHKEVRS